MNALGDGLQRSDSNAIELSSSAARVEGDPSVSGVLVAGEERRFSARPEVLFFDRDARALVDRATAVDTKHRAIDEEMALLEADLRRFSRFQYAAATCAQAQDDQNKASFFTWAQRQIGKSPGSILYCPIYPMVVGGQWNQIHLRFQDQDGTGTVAMVRVELKSIAANEGESTLFTFDTSDLRTPEIANADLPLDVTFDFTRRYYWLEVTLDGTHPIEGVFLGFWLEEVP